MKTTPRRLLPCLALPLAAASLSAETGPAPLFVQLSYAHESASDYHSGENSLASFLYGPANNTDYEINKVLLDVSYAFSGGLYLYAGFVASDIEINGDLAIANFDGDFEPRETTLGAGYSLPLGPVTLRPELRYTFNIDREFDQTGTLPTTDGGDYLGLSLAASYRLLGLDHTATFAYTAYEDDVSHPLFPSFSLGDRYALDYQILKGFGAFYAALGHTITLSEQTEGTPGFLGFRYLYEKPRYNEVRARLGYSLDSSSSVFASASYTYDGSDAAKDRKFTVGIDRRF